MVVFHELSKTCQIFSMSKTNQTQAMHTRIKLNFYTKIVNSINYFKNVAYITITFLWFFPVFIHIFLLLWYMYESFSDNQNKQIWIF